MDPRQKNYQKHYYGHYEKRIIVSAVRNTRAKVRSVASSHSSYHKMPNRGRNRRTTRSRRQRGLGHIGDEYMTFSVAAGSTLEIALSSVSTRPANTNFRPIFVAVECTQPCVVASASGDIAPSVLPGAVDVQIKDPSGKIVGTSRPHVLSAVKSRTYVRYPRSGDWFPVGGGASKLATVTSICLGPAGTTTLGQYLRGLIHIKYQFSYEILTGSCLTHLSSEVPEPPFTTGMWSDHVELVYPTWTVAPSPSPSAIVDLSFLDESPGSFNGGTWSRSHSPRPSHHLIESVRGGMNV